MCQCCYFLNHSGCKNCLLISYYREWELSSLHAPSSKDQIYCPFLFLPIQQNQNILVIKIAGALHPSWAMWSIILFCSCIALFFLELKKDSIFICFFFSLSTRSPLGDVSCQSTRVKASGRQHMEAVAWAARGTRTPRLGLHRVQRAAHQCCLAADMSPRYSSVC